MLRIFGILVKETVKNVCIIGIWNVVLGAGYLENNRHCRQCWGVRSGFRPDPTSQHRRDRIWIQILLSKIIHPTLFCPKFVRHWDITIFAAANLFICCMSGGNRWNMKIGVNFINKNKLFCLWIGRNGPIFYIYCIQVVMNCRTRDEKSGSSK